MRRFLLFVSLSILFYSCNNSQETTPKIKVVSGEELFQVNCAQCHSPIADFLGPAIKGAEGRWKDKRLLFEFIKAPQDVIAKDTYTRSLFLKWNQTYMPPFPNLTNEEIDSILEYCNRMK